MATAEKTKRVRKPRKIGTKTTRTPRKKKVEKAVETVVQRAVNSDVKVLVKDKIQLHKLPTLAHIDEQDLTDISVDSSLVNKTPYDAEIEYLLKPAGKKAYIDSEIQGTNSGTWIFDAKFSNSGDCRFIGFGLNGNKAIIAAGLQAANGTKKVPTCYGSWNNNAHNEITVTNRHTYKYIFKSGSQEFYCDDVKHSSSSKQSDESYTSTIGIFACINQDGSIQVNYLARGVYIYSCKLYDGLNNLVRDFIPVRKGSTGYLYDKVSGRLFEKLGSDSFTLGDDIPLTQSDLSVSLGTPLYRFSGIQDSSDVSALLDNSTAKRYHTDANELSVHDLKLFSEYNQQGTKKTYFNDHPYVVNDSDINSIAYEQLLTKNNLETAERYFVNRYLNSKSKLNTYNWETDDDIKHEVSGLNDLLDLDEWDSQATYKFEWGNDKRTTNVVDLGINAAYYYSVVGIVSVKSILHDQKSGTIYLEAKPIEKEDSDDNWIVMDSAVFKFDQDNLNSGTYITLSCYMSPGYVTRLKLNLRPNAYSMNNWEYREKGAIANHYSNTFVGNAYILDDIKKGDDLDIKTNIMFTDANYKDYKYDNRILSANLTNYFKESFIDTQMISIPVSTVVNTIEDHFAEQNKSIISLDISTAKQDGKGNQFTINGLRYSPTGKIHKLNEKMNLYSNCTLYPSYSSGTITVQHSSLRQAEFKLSNVGYSWQNGRVLANNLNIRDSNLTALPGIDWPENTRIYGNHQITGKIKQIISTLVTKEAPDTANAVSDPYTFSNCVVSSYATFKPRVDNQLNTVMIDFSPILNRYNTFGNITCDIVATPNTWGGGSGNESYGRIRYGFTNHSELTDEKTTAVSTIVNPVELKTKNITRWITNKLCTGSRWNVKEGTLATTIEQDHKYKHIWIQACADTAEDDKKPTNFSVTVTATIRFKYKYPTTKKYYEPGTTEVTSNFTYITEKTKEDIVKNSKIYPILSSSERITATTYPPIANDFRVDELSAYGEFHSTTLTVIPYPQYPQ